MARETKVGLLVGLAFIICFAVILSNRGREDSLASVAPFLPDLKLGSPKPAVASPSPTASLPVNAPSQAQTDHGRAPVGPNLLPMTEPAGAMTQADLERKVRELEQQLALASGPSTPQTVFNPAPGAETSVPLSSGTVSLQHAPAALADPVAPGPVAPGAGMADHPAVDASSAYTVKAGDTLSTIAQTKYGSRSKRVVDAIFAANRNQLPDADQIRPGMVLRLPKVEDGSPKPVQRASDHPKSTAKQAEKPVQKPAQAAAPAPAFTWYQVRKSEGYASIARNVLGNVDRWREIHELNKDKFPNPNQIREGVRIKIPQRGRK